MNTATDILLVEDNPADVRMVLEVLRSAPRVCRVQVVVDGSQALAFLRRQGAYEHATRPQLVLLDLNLPGLNGHEVLAEMKAEPHLAGIPVVIFSGSRDGQDIMKAYQLRASCYVSKPDGVEALRETLQGIEGFWIGTASLPLS